MADERTHGSSAAVTAAGAPTVKSIFIYPIKSCKGISVSKAPLSPTVVRAPGMAELKVSLAKPGLRSDGVSVWEWSGSALDEGDEAAKWFTDFLGKPSRLVRFNEESETRPTDPQYATGFNVKFPDAFPYLLISEPSLDALNEQLKEPVSINRFRPNIFASGCEPFAEDLWKQIKINELTFRGIMLCPRCKVPTINQEDAARGSEPRKTMMKFRSADALEVNTATTKYEGQPYLGQMLVCEDKTNKGKIVSVGDIIEVEKVFPSYADVAV